MEAIEKLEEAIKQWSERSLFLKTHKGQFELFPEEIDIRFRKIQEAITALKERDKQLGSLLEQLIWIAEKAPTDDSEDTAIELAHQALAALLQPKCKVKDKKELRANCIHDDLYPSMNLQLKMARCGHFLIHGNWECQKCGKWIAIECEDEWMGLEGTKSKDGKYEYRVIDGKNKIILVGVSKPKCKTCGGSGRKKWEVTEDWPYEYTTCPKCKGTGIAPDCGAKGD